VCFVVAVKISTPTRPSPSERRHPWSETSLHWSSSLGTPGACCSWAAPCCLSTWRPRPRPTDEYMYHMLKLTNIFFKKNLPRETLKQATLHNIPSNSIYITHLSNITSSFYQISTSHHHSIKLRNEEVHLKHPKPLVAPSGRCPPLLHRLCWTPLGRTHLPPRHRAVHPSPPRHRYQRVRSSQK
jgi:hypothetical protein